MGDMSAAALPPLTFDDATRQNIIPLSTFPFASGGTVSFTLPTSGLGARLYLGVTGTVSGTPSTTSTGPYSLFQRITVRANSGVVLFDCSGYGTYLLMLISTGAFDAGAWALTTGSTSTARNVLFNYSASVINFVLEVPLAWNRRDDIGLVMLQNQRAQVTVQIQFASIAAANTAITGPYTGGTNPAVTATIAPFLEFFTLPADPSLFPNLLILASRIESMQSMTASGDQTITMQRGNTFTAILHWIYNNNALDTADIAQGVLRYDQNVRPYQIALQEQLLLQAIRYQRFLPDGTWVWDLQYQGAAGLGYFRDTIDSEAVSELSSIITFTPAPTAPAVINTVAEQLIHLEMAQAAA